MLRLMSFSRGQVVRKYSLYIGNYFSVRWNFCEPANLDPYWTENLRGEITTTPSGRNNFNNCVHTEFYGSVFLPSYNDSDEEFIPGLSWEIFPSESCSGINVTLFSFSDGQTGAYALGLDTASGFWSGIGFSTSYGGAAKYTGAAGPDKDKVIAALLDESWYSPVYLEARIEKISKPNRKNLVVQSIEHGLQIYKNEFEYLFSFSKYDSKGFTNALLNCQDIPSALIACGVAIDGLASQAIASAAKTGNAVKGGSNYFKDLKNLGKLDLSVKYGVLAPFRDYMNFFKTIDRYYRDGLKPYFDTGTTSRLNETIDSWNVELYYGIRYNPYVSDTITDILAIMHQAGASLSTAQVWDLIPFSFAVDWLINIENFLETLDAKVNLQMYPIKYCWHTVKATRTVRILNSDCSFVYYNREALDTIPPITTDFSWNGVKGKLSLRNVGEAISLLGQFYY